MVLLLLSERSKPRPFDFFHIFVSLFLYLFAAESNLNVRLADFWQLALEQRDCILACDSRETVISGVAEDARSR